MKVVIFAGGPGTRIREATGTRPKPMMETMPANAYAVAKDNLHRQLQVQHDFYFKWVRLFYRYGAGQNPNSLLSQLDRALENKILLANGDKKIKKQ